MKKERFILTILLLASYTMAAMGQSVIIEDVKLVCNAVVNGEVGLKIVATYTASGLQGRMLYVDMGVLDAYGQPVYMSDGNPLYARLTRTPMQQNYRFSNDEVFLPAWAFSSLAGGNYQLNAVVQVMDVQTNSSLAISNYVEFAYNGAQQQYPNNGNLGNYGGGYSNGGNSGNTSNRNRCIICSGSGKCSYPTSINNKYYCQGTGKCHYCDGHSTGLPGTTSGYGVRTICGVCKGTNDCSYCHGTGKCSTCNGKGWRN